jgi:hypothetical protein
MKEIKYFILLGRTPIAVDLMTWANACERVFRAHIDGDDPWRIGHDQINERCRVSTVFLGLNHNFGRGEPLLFETMIFGGPLAGEMSRYCTYNEAERGHAAAVVQAKKACAQIATIKDRALHSPDDGEL